MNTLSQAKGAGRFKRTVVLALMAMSITLTLSLPGKVHSQDGSPTRYPDVWELVLPDIPENKVGNMPTEVFDINVCGDGSYVVAYHIESGFDKERQEQVLKMGYVDFFKRQFLGAGEYEVFERISSERGGCKSADKTWDIGFSDGTRIMLADRGLIESGPSFVQTLKKLRNKNGVDTPEKEVNIIYVQDMPFRQWVWGEEAEGVPRDYILSPLTVVLFDTAGMVKLNDDTFLCYKWNFVLRLDKNLETKSGIPEDKLFIVDADVIRGIEKNINDPFYSLNNKHKQIHQYLNSMK